MAAARGYYNVKSSLIRKKKLDLLLLHLEANAYYELANFDSYQQKPSAIANLADTKIEECLKKPLVLHYLYVTEPSQSVERHVKLVTEASAKVERFDRQDGSFDKKN